jgi:hypothetical protein
MRNREKSLTIVAYLLIFTGIISILYWILFFLGITKSSDEPIYLAFEHSFPAADAWMATCAITAGIGLLKEKSWGYLFTLLTSSSLIFLGLMDVLFNIENKMYLNMTSEMIIETIINIVCLTFGPFLIPFIWSKIKRDIREK